MTSFEIRGPVQPGSGPLERLMAPEFSGKIAQDALKVEFVAAAERLASNVERVRQDLHEIGWGIDSVAGAVESLENQLVPRFDSQLHHLGEQLAALRSIDASLKSPRRVAAAERIQQTADLLRAQRYDRALQYAQEAIEHDATNPGGFMAAAWASIGSNRTYDAIDYFVEASAVAKTYEPRVGIMRQLARCQLATGDQQYFPYARENLDRIIRFVGKATDSQASHVKKLETGDNHYLLPEARTILESRKLDLATLEYEASIAAAMDGDYGAAVEHIEAAVRIDERFAKLAVGEPLFTGCDFIPIHALSIARLVKEERRLLEEELANKQRVGRLQAERKAAIPNALRRLDIIDYLLNKTVWPWQTIPGWYTEKLVAADSELREVYRYVESIRNTIERLDKKEILNNIEVDILAELDSAQNALKRVENFWLFHRNRDRSIRKASKRIEKNMRKSDHIFALLESNQVIPSTWLAIPRTTKR